MKSKLAAVLLAATVVAQAGVASFAEGSTASLNELIGVPFRLTTGVVGGSLGLVTGSINGITDTEKKFAENTFEKAGENPAMLPVGLVGAALAIPVGILTGGPQGLADGMKSGYNYWSKDSK
ncbi:MAG: hypothetical protein K2X01_01785 [Cyanobacteria bacterium]|nr:hypothetical protein [Cyanobacteriota bacterium]